jgi:hypothetical protein
MTDPLSPSGPFLGEHDLEEAFKRAQAAFEAAKEVIFLEMKGRMQAQIEALEADLTPEMRARFAKTAEMFGEGMPPSTGTTPTAVRDGGPGDEIAGDRQARPVCHRPHIDDLQIWNPAYKAGKGSAN